MPRDAEILAAVTTRAKQLLDDYPTELAIRQRLGQVGGHVQYPALLKPAGPPFTLSDAMLFIVAGATVGRGADCGSQVDDERPPHGVVAVEH